jgi:hypothetical protein
MSGNEVSIVLKLLQLLLSRDLFKIGEHRGIERCGHGSAVF